MYLLITTNLLFVSSNIFAQGDESIKLLLMENCRILRPYEVSEFIIHDQGGSSIKGTYEVGEVHFQLQDSRYFYHSDSIVVSFVHQSSRGDSRREYEVSLPTYVISGRYLIVNIYNFDDGSVSHYFRMKEGYSYEVEAPGYSSRLPVKSRRALRLKRKCNCY